MCDHRLSIGSNRNAWLCQNYVFFLCSSLVSDCSLVFLVVRSCSTLEYCLGLCCFFACSWYRCPLHIMWFQAVSTSFPPTELQVEPDRLLTKVLRGCGYLLEDKMVKLPLLLFCICSPPHSQTSSWLGLDVSAFQHYFAIPLRKIFWFLSAGRLQIEKLGQGRQTLLLWTSFNVKYWFIYPGSLAFLFML